MNKPLLNRCDCLEIS